MNVHEASTFSFAVLASWSDNLPFKPFKQFKSFKPLPPFDVAQGMLSSSRRGDEGGGLIVLNGLNDLNFTL